MIVGEATATLTHFINRCNQKIFGYVSLDRNEAIAIYKQIMNLSDSMGANTFNLRESGTNNYQIRIRIGNVNEIIKELTDLAKSNDL